MARVEVTLQPRAKQDLEEIWLYTYKTWDIEQAENYTYALNDQFKALVRNPEMGRKCDYIRDGYHRLETLKHIIFYRLTKNGVIIIRILHQTMDVQENF